MRIETRREIVKVKFDEFVAKFNEEYKDTYKIVYVDKTCWNNACTRLKSEITDLYFLGADGNSGNPNCIIGLEVDDTCYQFRAKLNHTNLSDGVYKMWYELDGKKFILYVHEFCNPVKKHHVYRNPHAAKILKGQLMGQNGNSPMQTVNHVCNEGVDYAIRANGHVLKSKSHPLNLLTRVNSLSSSVDVIEELRRLTLPKNENEHMVKLRENDRYVCLNVRDLQKLKSEDKISPYYPIIDYETTKKLLEDAPKCEVDFTVIGLGSAGTGVLDQVARSTYFKTYMLIDFDRVEGKNLRNQWYTRSHLSEPKVSSSASCLWAINEYFHIIRHNSHFETVTLSGYKSKYVISGFDNLECRLKLLDLVTSGEFECRYLIDLRYLDYECSIYFIDLDDEKQVKYYRSLLEADKEVFDAGIEYITTKEELIDYWKNKNLFECNCTMEKGRLGMSFARCSGKCGSERCKDDLWITYQNAPNKIVKTEEENSCIKQNFIDIYKYASSFVFAAIREIEGDEPKPFTHIEAQTTVIPTSVIIRK